MGQDLKNIFDTMVDPQVKVSIPTAKDTKDKVIMVSLKGDLGINAANQVDYKFYSNGEIVVTNSLLPNASLGNLPRFGMKMEVNSDLQNMEYFGRGPVENYSDRNSGSLVGVYNTNENGEKLTVDGQEFKYLHPQEFANRTGVRWTSLTDDNGNGLMVAAENTMESGATRYQPEALGIGNRGTPALPLLADTSIRSKRAITSFGRWTTCREASATTAAAAAQLCRPSRFRTTRI